MHIYIYIYIWLISPLKGGSQDKAFCVRDILLSLPPLHHLFVAENTEEGLPRPLVQLTTEKSWA